MIGDQACLVHQAQSNLQDPHSEPRGPGLALADSSKSERLWDERQRESSGRLHLEDPSDYNLRGRFMDSRFADVLTWRAPLARLQLVGGAAPVTGTVPGCGCVVTRDAATHFAKKNRCGLCKRPLPPDADGKMMLNAAAPQLGQDSVSSCRPLLRQFKPGTIDNDMARLVLSRQHHSVKQQAAWAAVGCRWQFLSA